MKRKWHKIDGNAHNTTIIAVDTENAEEIMSYLFRNEGIESEFKEIRHILKENLRNREKYCKADVSSKAENMYEMRFTRNGRNDRIYCQESRKSKARVVVMVELFEFKKSDDIPKKIKGRIETMGGYIYE